MISQEMSNRLWKEDELLEAMNLGAGTCFLEGVVVGDEENDEDGGDGRWWGSGEDEGDGIEHAGPTQTVDGIHAIVHLATDGGDCAVVDGPASCAVGEDGDEDEGGPEGEYEEDDDREDMEDGHDIQWINNLNGGDGDGEDGGDGECAGEGDDDREEEDMGDAHDNQMIHKSNDWEHAAPTQHVDVLPTMFLLAMGVGGSVAINGTASDPVVQDGAEDEGDDEGENAWDDDRDVEDEVEAANIIKTFIDNVDGGERDAPRKILEDIPSIVPVAADVDDIVVVDGPAFGLVGEDGDDDEGDDEGEYEGDDDRENEDDAEDANENQVIYIESDGKRAEPRNTLEGIPGIVPLVAEVGDSVVVDGTASGPFGKDDAEDEEDEGYVDPSVNEEHDEDEGNPVTWHVSRGKQMPAILPFNPNSDMVARYGPYVRCDEVPCKALFLGNECKAGKMIPT